jgi:hypothetical protein
MGLKKLLFELICKLGFKKSPDIEQKKDPRRKQPRFPSVCDRHSTLAQHRLADPSPTREVVRLGPPAAKRPPQKRRTFIAGFSHRAMS